MSDFRIWQNLIYQWRTRRAERGREYQTKWSMVGGPLTSPLEVIKKSQTEIWGVPLPPNMIEEVQLHLLTSGKEKIENSLKKNLFKLFSFFQIEVVTFEKTYEN